MAILTPAPTFDDVTQLEATDLALAGPGAIMNMQAQKLLNRTQWFRVRYSLDFYKLVDTTTMNATTTVSFVPVDGTLYVLAANNGTYELPDISICGVGYRFTIQSPSYSLCAFIKGHGTDNIVDRFHGWGTSNKVRVNGQEAWVFTKRVDAGVTYWDVVDIHNDMPAGTIVLRNETPNASSAWLPCNNASKLVADYPRLFAAIGYNFGGSGANFTMPSIASIGSGASTIYYMIRI